MSGKKMGRPTDNPKSHKVSIRINDTENQILENYCVKENVSKSEAISRGIRGLEQKK